VSTVVTAFAVLVPPAFAEEPSAADVSAARDLGREGVKLADAGTCAEAIDKLRDTASAHQRAFIVETMGRNCGYIALMAGIAGGAEVIAIPECEVEPHEVAERLRAAYQRGKTHAVVVVAEGAQQGAQGAERWAQDAEAHGQEGQESGEEGRGEGGGRSGQAHGRTRGARRCARQRRSDCVVRGGFRAGHPHFFCTP
jgi:6-phosphofructokinase